LWAFGIKLNKLFLSYDLTRISLESRSRNTRVYIESTFGVSGGH
jgi:hypothetical protein